MARLSKSALLDRVLSALDDSGWKYVVTSALHPFELVLLREGDSLRVRIYLWNITHGGGSARAEHEYRVQITGLTRFQRAKADRVVILGWWEEAEVFAGWDVTRHSQTLGSSPSLQVREETLRKAVIETVATQRRANDEIAICFTPDFLGTYIDLLPDLHSLAKSTRDLQLLERIAKQPETSGSKVALVTVRRRETIAQVVRKLRESSFSRRVLVAYSHRCCMCGVQLKLVEAAHILAVAVGNSDSTSNGLALCALHHRAYDRSLLTIDERYKVMANPAYVAEIRRQSLDSGLSRFLRGLRPIIYLPPDPRDRPDAGMVKEANRVRRWAAMEEVG